MQVHCHTWAFGKKTGQDTGQEFRGCRGVGKDPDMPRCVGVVLGELAFHIVHLAHDHPRMVQEQFTGGGQFNPAAVAVQQAAGQVLFQALDPCTGGWRRDKRLARTLGEAGGFGDMNKQAQVDKIKMHG